VSKAARERVRAAVEAIGYRPDPVVARVAASRWRPSARAAAIAVVDGRASVWADAVAEAAKQAGFRPLMHPPDANARSWNERGVVGVVLGPQLSQRAAEALPLAEVAVAAIGGVAGDPPAHVVMPDWPAAVARARAELASRGRRRVGGIVVDDAGTLTARHLDAALVAVTDVPLLRYRDQAGLRAWYRRHRPDGVIGFAPVLWWRLREIDFRTERELAFVSLQRPTATSRVRCGWLEVPVEALAREAVALLEEQIRRGERGRPARRRTVLLEPAWHPGRLDADVS
jgi:DNA-binding LacI/PurR family transcriptional regulator